MNRAIGECRLKYGMILPVKAAGSHCEKSFFEIFQSQLKGFIRIPDFTNFPASTGFLVMEKKELPCLMQPGKFGRECLIKYVY